MTQDNQHTDETRDFENFLIEEMGPHVLAGDKMRQEAIEESLRTGKTVTYSAGNFIYKVTAERTDDHQNAN